MLDHVVLNNFLKTSRKVSFDLEAFSFFRYFRTSSFRVIGVLLLCSESFDIEEVDSDSERDAEIIPGMTSNVDKEVVAHEAFNPTHAC